MVGVDVGIENVSDLQSVFGGRGDVLVGVSSGVDDDRLARTLRPDEIGETPLRPALELHNEEVVVFGIDACRLVQRVPVAHPAFHDRHVLEAIGVQFGRERRRRCALSTDCEYFPAVCQPLDLLTLVVTQGFGESEREVLRPGNVPRLVAIRRAGVDQRVVVSAGVLCIRELSGGDYLEHSLCV